MTTPDFLRRAGPVAQAMNTVYERAQKGEKSGTFACPKCGSRVSFTVLAGHRSEGRCSAAGCIKWSN